MKLSEKEREKYGIDEWRCPAIDPDVEEAEHRVEMPKRRDPMTKYKWLVGIMLVLGFLVASKADLEVAEGDAAYYQKQVEEGIWPRK